MKKLQQFLKETYAIEFNDPKLLKEAFTHSSYVNEHQKQKLNDNERIEFLGDAVLELTVSEYLYEKYPEFPEGYLTKMRASIVCEASLSQFAKECGFNQYVLLGKGEQRMNGKQRPALLCDLFEAFIGALYLDQGVESVQTFLKKTVYKKIDSGAFSHGMDFKTELQEFLQKNGEVSIQYRIVEEIGPAHMKEFVTQVFVEEDVVGEGKGSSKKNAEQAAAENALRHLKENNKQTMDQ
ncbi:ribonuclease III [Lacticigenium naphthae]|uniref:ribonuclease III n=1 Tax=Lacticigenium naphthae TaxID=515351 RepID=UPI0003F7ED32|nr:ribonuclease III [Lacticigenium naphthae]